MAEEEKSDGLEIISIGKLYDGPLDKKYWSSSRGKDRYPYPVGYKAVRTQNQVVYTMEILEGLKGPIFMISSTDGQSCSGQTPNIVWNNFQKKGCVQIKLWHGKRLSCKIDGVELFGFKNPIVQRLLRELASYVNLTEQSSLSSTSINGACGTILQDLTQCTKCCKAPCTCPNIQPDLGNPLLTRKRSVKNEVSSLKSKKEGNFKRTRQGDEANNVDVSKSGQCCPNHLMNRYPSTSSTPKEEKAELETVTDDGHSPLLAEKEIQFGSANSSRSLKQAKDVAATECNNRFNSRNSIPKEEAITFFDEKELSYRSKFTGTQGLGLLKQVEEAGETFVPKDSQSVNDMDLFAPDTLDLQLDGNYKSVMDIPKESLSNIEDSNASQLVVAKDSIAEARAEELVISTANDNSEKFDTDSVGHEIAESMISILLPRAIPFLKSFSRKKKTTTKSAEVSRKGLISEGKKEGSYMSTGLSLPAAELRPEDLNNERQMNITNTPRTDFTSVLPSYEDSASIAPDSFESEQQNNTESTQLQLFQDVTEADHSGFGQHSCIPENSGLYCAASNLPTLANDQVKQRHSPVEKNPNRDERKLEVQSQKSLKDKLSVLSEGAFSNIAPALSHEVTALTSSRNDFADACNASISCEGKPHSKELTGLQGNNVYRSKDQGAKSHDKTGNNTVDCLNVNDSTDEKHNSEKMNMLELVGCYVHPMPISTILMRTKGNEMYICVLCGYQEKDKSVFVYKVPVNGKERGCPFIIGHASLLSPYLYAYGREIALDSYSLQLTPDGQCLVLHNSIKAPYCSAGNVYCPCSVCTSACFATNAVKIVELKLGYVSTALKLKTIDSVCCILVCEPCYLLAAEESGRLHMWTMNSSWTDTSNESQLPTSDSMPGCIVQMKRIPKSEAFVVGHNAFGEFCLWDITKQILVSKFSAPQISVCHFLPVSTFRFPSTGFGTAGIDYEEYINCIMDETNMWFTKEGDKHDSSPAKNDDVAVCLLISCVTDSDTQHGHQSNSSGVNPIGCWSLALLARKTVILGNTLDPRAAVVGTSGGYGIMSTCDKLVYMWDMSKGTELGALQYCKGAKVSYIAADDSDSGAFAITCDDSQLQIYMPSAKVNLGER